MTHIKDVLDELVGYRIDGGCEDCGAFQSMKAVHDLYLLTIHHDDACTTLQRHQQQDARS